MARSSAHILNFVTGLELDKARDSTQNLTFSRRYLDANRVTYEVREKSLDGFMPLISLLQYHTGHSNHTFDTIKGREITKGLEELAVKFDLSYFYGTAPHDYRLNLFVPLHPLPVHLKVTPYS